LEDAEKKLQTLVNEQKKLSVGDTARSENWEGVLKKAELTDAVYPSNTSGQYNYYSAGSDSVLLDLEFDVKNLNTETLAFADFANNIVVSYGDYKYNNYEMFYDMGTSLSVTLLKGEYVGPAPLDVTRLYILFSLPKEVATSDLPVSVSLTVAGTERVIAIR